MEQKEPTAEQQNPKNQAPKPKSKTRRPPRPRVVFQNIIHWFQDLFSLHLDTDEMGTIESIRKSIEFKGGNLWGLLFAAIIASIGLNMNSGAVVIGAMLISPLMGPIVGIGFAMATNDFDTLKYAFRNLAIFIIGSVLAATFYFSISPIKTLTDQLEARTHPTFYDVLIAICGGAIGIVASSRADRGNAIPGVAIATALMPPLCTVGYGLATAQWSCAGGALYLFFINSVFIAGTSLIFVRALNFPQKEFIDPARERNYKMLIVGIVVCTIVPSLWSGYYLVKHELFNSKAVIFSERVTQYNLEKGVILSQRTDYHQDTPVITLTTTSGVVERDKGNLRRELEEVGLGYAKLEFKEGNLDMEVLLAEVGELRNKFSLIKEEYTTMLQKLYKDNEVVLKNKDQRIELLENELAKYQTQNRRTSKPVDDIAKEFGALYPEATTVAYNELIKMNTTTYRLDTIPTVVIDWEGRRIRENQLERMKGFFKVRMKLDTVELVVY